MVHTIGCVSFLNSRPLIDPLIGRADVQTLFDVPARLIDLIEAATVSTALMSVVDYHRSRTDVVLVPAGMIGCDGPTLTVRVFSRVPVREIRVLHGDTDSHTSLILAQVILRECHGVRPALLPLTQGAIGQENVESMVLIGDKVVNAAPDAREFPWQMDLGEQWKRLTGLPFVFAMWMMRRDRVAQEGQAVGRMLQEARRRGADLTEHLLDRYAQEKRWPRDLARRYFTEYLRYEVTPAARQGLARFFELASSHGLLEIRRTVEYLEIAP